LAEEINDPGVSRVFARSAFEYGHEPEAPAADADALVVVTVLQARLACAVPLPPQASISNPAAIRRTTLSVMRELIAT
jgi:hypothetical protein